MTGPLTDVQARWNELFPGAGRTLPASERAQWARVVRAMAEADEHLAADPTGRSRGDTMWCTVAVHMHEVLHDARAFGHLDQAPPGVCVADETVIRAWLNAPVVTADSPPGLTQVTRLPALPGPAGAVPALVARIQDVGLLGVAGQRIDLAPYAGDPDHGHTFVLTVDPAVPDGRTTPLLDLGDCWRPGQAVIDTVVSVLGRVADHTHRVLGNPGAGSGSGREPLPDGVHGYAIRGRRSRPFPGLSTVDVRTSAGGGQQPPPVDQSPGRSR